MLTERDLFEIGGILHEARMRECYGDWDLSSRRKWPTTLKDFTRQRHAGQPWIDVAVAQANAIEALLSDKFDLGFKAAGGTMIPDGARNMVELALDRGQINALADIADDVVDPKSRWYSSEYAPGLSRFLETISIYRRKA